MGGQIEAIATALPSSGDAAELRAALAVMAMVGVTSGHQLLALPVPHDAPPNASPYCCARPSTPGLLGRLGARRRLPGMTGPFRTARLDVVPLRIEHAAEMAAVLSDPALHTFIGGAPASPENLRARYRRLVAGSPDPSVTWCNWVLRLREDSRLVGTSRPRSDRPSRRSPGWSAPRGSGGAWPPEAARVPLHEPAAAVREEDAVRHTPRVLVAEGAEHLTHRAQMGLDGGDLVNGRQWMRSHGPRRSSSGTGATRGRRGRAQEPVERRKPVGRREP